MWSTCTTQHRQRTGFRSAAQLEAAAVLVPPPPPPLPAGSNTCCRLLHAFCCISAAVCCISAVVCYMLRVVYAIAVLLSTAHAGLSPDFVDCHSGTAACTVRRRTQEVFDVLVEFEHSKNESYLFENCTNLRRSIAPTLRPKYRRQPTWPLP